MLNSSINPNHPLYNPQKMLDQKKNIERQSKKDKFICHIHNPLQVLFCKYTFIIHYKFIIKTSAATSRKFYHPLLVNCLH